MSILTKVFDPLSICCVVRVMMCVCGVYVCACARDDHTCLFLCGVCMCIRICVSVYEKVEK